MVTKYLAGVDDDEPPSGWAAWLENIQMVLIVWGVMAAYGGLTYLIILASD